MFCKRIDNGELIAHSFYLYFLDAIDNPFTGFVGQYPHSLGQTKTLALLGTPFLS